jgi:cytochrome c551/c552
MRTLASLCLTLAVIGAGCAKNDTAPAEVVAGAAGGEVGPDGPTSIVLPDGLDADAKKGEELYASKGCKACHNLDGTKLVGPGFDGVSKRHSVAWMARMVLKPEVMVKEDPAAKKLLGAYMTPMANQMVNPETELPNILAFLKSK